MITVAAENQDGTESDSDSDSDSESSFDRDPESDQDTHPDPDSNADSDDRQRSSVRRRLRVADALDDAGFGDVYVVSQESADRVLTPARRAIVETLATEAVESQRELAALLDRDPGNVKRDVDVLVDEGVIARKKHGRAYRPFLKYDAVVAEPIPTIDS